MKTHCYSVRLQSLSRISDKCFKAVDFNGNEDLIPASQIFGTDYDVQKSEAYWISSWILEKKNITYSAKKEGFFNPDTRQVEPKYRIEIEKHIPETKQPVIDNTINELKR